jgi:hypothetical protein
MVWARKPLPAKMVEVEPTLIGLDLNATRARAVHGPARTLPRTLPLAGAAEELPMILSLQGRQAEVGRAGIALCRLMPHLTCVDFLAYLGQPRQWVAGRHHLDAVKAVALVFEHFQSALAGAGGVVLTVPAYLTRAQVLLMPPLAGKARLPLLGSVRSPLAQALASYRAEPWSGLALVVDVDDHALTAAAVIAGGDQLSVHGGQSWSHLSLRVWKGRLLDAVADRCIRQSRRDPRDCAPVEQELYEQIEEALDHCSEGRAAEFLMQTTHWYQHLVLRAEEITAFCERLVGQTVHGIQEFLTTITTPEALHVVLVSQAAGRLPGLVSALQKKFPGQLPIAEPEISEDFGEDLLQQRSEPARVAVQPADAAAQASHELAGRIQSGELPRGHLDFTIPLPKGDAPGTAGDAKKRTFRLLSFDR